MPNILAIFDTLTSLSDTTIVGLADGDTLQYDFATSKWKNIPVGGGAGVLWQRDIPTTTLSPFFAGDNILTTGNVTIDSDTAGLVLGESQYTLLSSSGAGMLQFSTAYADTDITLLFIGTTNSGQFSWLEDEDRFEFADAVKALSLYSAATITSEAEMWVKSDLLGINFGASQDATIYFDGSDLIINNNGITANVELVVSNFTGVDFWNSWLKTTGNVTIDSNANGLVLGDGQEVSMLYNGTDTVITPPATSSLEYATATAGEGIISGVAFVGRYVSAAANAVFSHTAMQADATGYSVMQSTAGRTYLNSEAGQTTAFQIGASIEATMSSTTFDFTNLDLTTSGDVTIDSDVSGLILGESQDSTIYFDNTDLNIAGEATHDVALFKDADVGVGVDGHSLYIHRKGTDPGDDYCRIFVGHTSGYTQIRGSDNIQFWPDNTYVGQWYSNGFIMTDEKAFQFGGSTDVSIHWESSGAIDYLSIATHVNAALQSGYISILEDGDRGIANRVPAGVSLNPVLRIYSSDGTSAVSYMESFHDQTDANITVGLGDLQINCPTDKTLELTETVYKDINMGAAQLSRPASSQPDIDEFVDEVGADTGIETYAFAPSEKVSGSFEMQHDYKEGTDIVFHVHFQIIAAPGGGTDNVKWQLIYTFGKNGDTLDAVTTIVIEDAVTTQYAFYQFNFPTISDATIDIGDQFLFQLSRVAASTDEFAGDCLIATAGIHYQCNTIGSRQIGTK